MVKNSTKLDRNSNYDSTKPNDVSGDSSKGIHKKVLRTTMKIKEVKIKKLNSKLPKSILIKYENGYAKVNSDFVTQSHLAKN